MYVDQFWAAIYVGGMIFTLAMLAPAIAMFYVGPRCELIAKWILGSGMTAVCIGFAGVMIKA